MKKLFLLGFALLSYTAFAQNIDTGYEKNPSGSFIAIGLVENRDHHFAEDDMKSNANRICGYKTGARQVTKTRFRSVYTYLYASAEFQCLGNRESEYSALIKEDFSCSFILF